MAVFRNGGALRRRWFLLLTLLAFALMLVTGGILWHSVETSSVAVMQARVDALKPMFTGFRLFLITLVAAAWPFVTSTLNRFGQIDDVQASILLALRWRIVIWLVVIELVLGQNLIGQIFLVLQGSVA